MSYFHYPRVPFEQAEEEEMETDRGGNEEDNDSDDGVNFYGRDI